MEIGESLYAEEARETNFVYLLYNVIKNPQINVPSF
jgi:hypothetical protein